MKTAGHWPAVFHLFCYSTAYLLLGRGAGAAGEPVVAGVQLTNSDRLFFIQLCR
jgi:hypothetical protein